MTNSERAIKIVLRVVGITGLFAMPAIFLPLAWMNAIHGFLGLGELPDAPIVRYLARSLSTFYAMFSVTTLLIASDIRRYRALVKLWGLLVTVAGFVLLGIDLNAGMPTSWTLSEGPPAVAVGLAVLWLSRHIAQGPDSSG